MAAPCNLTSKTALVTGGSRGIGNGIAVVLVKRGCGHVIITGTTPRTPEQVKSMTMDIQKHGPNTKVNYLSADLSKREGIQSLCEQLEKLCPSGVDILCNNAGFQHVCPVEEFPDEKWDDMISTMLTATFKLTKHQLPFMKKKGWGRIINTSSIQGIQSTANKAPYCTIKHGINGFTKSVALETALYGITCNAICMGWVETELTNAQIAVLAKEKGVSFEDFKTEMARSIPTRKSVKPEEIGEMVAYLCLEAASQVTGTSLTIDGGATARLGLF